jgi:hypothetical protein
MVATRDYSRRDIWGLALDRVRDLVGEPVSRPQHSQINVSLRRWLIFFGLLGLAMVPSYFWTISYLRANYAPYDPQALYKPSISRVGSTNAYWTEITPAYRVGDPDASEHPHRSELKLYEDGVLLGPAHTGHEVIAALGNGRYSHWRTNRTIIMFSASDNSDPRTNGRVYRVTN